MNEQLSLFDEPSEKTIKDIQDSLPNGENSKVVDVEDFLLVEEAFVETAYLVDNNMEATKRLALNFKLTDPKTFSETQGMFVMPLYMGSRLGLSMSGLFHEELESHFGDTEMDALVNEAVEEQPAEEMPHMGVYL